MFIKDGLGIHEGTIAQGNRLADTPMSEGGFFELFDPAYGLDIEDPFMRGFTAMMLKNSQKLVMEACGQYDSKRRGYVINEAASSALLGGLAPNFLGIIRASVPSNPLNDLVSVQPTDREYATIAYLDLVYDQTKGNIPKGKAVSTALQGIPYVVGTAPPATYTSEQVTGEATTSGAGTDTLAGTLSYVGNGVRPGTVSIVSTHSTAGAATTFFDNQLGGFTTTSGLTISAGTINYATGAFSITVSAGTFTSAVAVSSSYSYDSEGSEPPKVRWRLSQEAVKTDRRALKMENTVESQKTLLSNYGFDLNSEMLTTAAGIINWETSRAMISRLWNASSSAGSFNINGFTGISRTDHYKDFAIRIADMSATIENNTRNGMGNRLIVDSGALTLVRALGKDRFNPAERAASYNGVVFVGTLDDNIRVYRDNQLVNEVGASTTGNLLMTWKGPGLFDSPAVYAPLWPLYTSDKLTLTNLVTSQSFASKSAMKVYNPAGIVRMTLTTA